MADEERKFEACVSLFFQFFSLKITKAVVVASRKARCQYYVLYMAFYQRC